MIRLRALGRCVVEVGDQRITPESDVLFALLLYLSSSAGRAVPRGDLLDLLWPSSRPASARHRLRQALYQLKRLGVPLAAEDASIVLRESDVELDYLECMRERESLVRSVASGAIEFLPRYAPAFSAAFARWVEEERDRVRALIRHRLIDEIARSRARGEHGAVVSLGRACLALDPLNSEATLAVAESLAMRGSRAEALGMLDRYRLEGCADDEDLSQAHAVLRRRIVQLGRRASASARGESLLAGRSEIINELNAWIAGGAEVARVYAFCGDAGIGKTRLLNEGVRIATLRGIRCVEYRPSAAGNERPLAGLLDLLPCLLAQPGAAGCSPESYARLTAISHGGHAKSTIPEDSTDSAFRFAILRRSLFDLVEAILAEGELLVAIDDVHALDRPTLELLMDATRCPGQRLAVMIAYRPSADLATFLSRQGGDVRLVPVPPLDTTAARSIVEQYLSAETAAKQSHVIDWAVDLANGNPFFLAELSTHFGTESGYGSLPPSLQVALDRKIDALSSTSRLMVQACAVLGVHSTLERLERMLEVPPHSMAAALADLELAGLITLRGGRVVCRHDLIAEAVLRGVTGAFGSYLHRRCALVLETELQTSAAASLAWDTASHWGAADDFGRALEVTGRIVDQLLSLGLPQEAADLCARAERYCRTPEQHAERLLQLSHAQRLLFDWEGVVASLQRRRTVTGGRRRIPKYSEDEIAIFEARWWRDCDGTILRPALHRVTDYRAPAIHRLQMAVLALIVADNQHKRLEALEIGKAVDSIDATTPREDREKAKALMIYHTAFGNLDEALVAGQRVVDTERVSGTTAGLLKALRWLSLPLRLTNDIAAAVSVLKEAYEGASRLGLRSEMWNAAFYLEGVALDCEDLALALEWAPVVADLVGDATIHPLRRSDHHYFEARIEYMRGNYPAAKVLLARSRDLIRSLPAARGEQSALALDVLLRVRMDARTIPTRTLTRLHQLHVRTRDSGTQDFETAALVSGLIHSGQLSEARHIFDYYAQVRRSRISNHPTFERTRAQLER